MRISGFGLRQAEVQTRDCRHVSWWACYLVRVDVSKSDSRHEADSPFHAITKSPGILDASVVLMSRNKRVNEAHHHDPKLEASQEHLGEQVMLEMVSSWKRRSLSPNKGKHFLKESTHVVIRERVGFIRTSNPTHLFITLNVKSLSRA